MKQAPIIAMFPLLLSACGGAKETINQPDAVSGATDVHSPVSSAVGEVRPETAATELPACLQPIDGPASVWPRIEAARAMPREQLVGDCGLGFAALIGRFATLPVDLLGPIVKEAAKDEATFDAWVAKAAVESPKLAADVISMDIANAWTLGADPALVSARAARWEASVEAPEEIASALCAAKELAFVLAEVNELHRLRCALEVNPLGFAVDCEPIHPQGKQIVLSWKTATRDGLLEDLELSSCKGASCKALKRTAAELETRYLALTSRLEQVKSDVLRAQVEAWLVLRPFTSVSHQPLK